MGKHTNISISNMSEDRDFPLECKNLHSLEGSLWKIKKICQTYPEQENEVYLFCQVAPHQFALVELGDGNRFTSNILTGSSYQNTEVRANLQKLERFQGSVTLSTKIFTDI